MKAMTKIVKKVLDRKIEDKIICNSVSLANHNSSISTGDCYPLVPRVAQGTDDWNRVGSKIRPKYLRVTGRLALVFDPTNQTPASGGGYMFTGTEYMSPLVVRLIAFTQNDIKSGLSGASVDTGALLRGDNGAMKAFQGYTADLLRPVNTDKFKVLKDKQYELVPCPKQTIDGVYRTQVPFSFKIKCPASLKYDDNSANAPNNFCPFIAVGYGYPNQSPPDTIQTPLVMEVISTLCYEDA